MWAACLNDLEKHGQFPAWQEKYMKLMFDVNDKSGKGSKVFYLHIQNTNDYHQEGYSGLHIQ